MDEADKTELPAAPAQKEYLIIGVEPEALQRARARCALSEAGSLESVMADMLRVYGRGVMIFVQGHL